MKVYTYEKETGYYGIEHNCQPDPLNGGWLYPNDYTILVPEFIEKKYPKWDGTKWKQVDDNRGIWYSVIDGHQVDIKEIEGSIENLTRLPKPSEDYYWNGTAWVLKSESEILANYKTKKFNDLDNEITNKLMYIKKLKKLDDVKSLFIDEYKKNQMSIAEVDASIALIRTDLFEV